MIRLLSHLRQVDHQALVQGLGPILERLSDVRWRIRENTEVLELDFSRDCGTILP